MSRFLVCCFIVLTGFFGAVFAIAQQSPEPVPPSSSPEPRLPETPLPESLPSVQDQANQQQVDGLTEPLYNPFVERYVLDELKQLRTDMAVQRAEFLQKLADRELSSADRGVSYATNAITYFFYLIAAASSILVLVGWTSIREMKERVHSLADQEISKLVLEYEGRLESIETQMSQKTQHIEENREEIERTQEIQSLWLRAAQESNPADQIVVYDQILKLRSDDCEALTYKADAVLELGEPQWAANLCHQALIIDSENSHAFYQLACAYAALNKYEESINYLKQAIALSDSYREKINSDAALEPIANFEAVKKLQLKNS